MLNLRIVTLAVLLCSPPAAMAADLVEPTPEDPWTGLYVGGHIGWGFGDQDFSASCVCPPDVNVDVDYDGLIGGAQIGFNYQFAPQWLVGVEADISWADMDGDGEENLPVPDTTIGVTEISSSAEEFGTIRARLGLILDDWLIYGTGGVAWGDVETHFHVSYTGAVTDEFSDEISDITWGWTVGAGTEYALDDHWRVKLEYLYVDLGGGGDEVEFSGGFGYFSETEDFEFHVVRAGINYQF